MKFLKYHLIFIITNTIAIVLVNGSTISKWVNKFVIILWLIEMSISIFILSYLLQRLQKNIKTIYILVCTYTVTYLTTTVLFALIGPDRYGFISNLISIYKDKDLFFDLTVPYLISITLVLVTCLYDEKESARAVSSKL